MWTYYKYVSYRYLSVMWIDDGFGNLIMNTESYIVGKEFMDTCVEYH